MRTYSKDMKKLFKRGRKGADVSGKSQTAGSVRETCIGCPNLNNSPTSYWCDVKGKRCSKGAVPKQECHYGEESALNTGVTLSAEQR